MINNPAIWFRRVTLCGVLVNLLFAVPGLFIPNAVIGLMGGEPATQPIWPAFASLQLILLSCYYIPGALDPFKYRLNAILSVAGRCPGALFFLVLSCQYPIVGYIDLSFAVVGGILLLLAYRTGPDDILH